MGLTSNLMTVTEAHAIKHKNMLLCFCTSKANDVPSNRLISQKNCPPFLSPSQIQLRPKLHQIMGQTISRLLGATRLDVEVPEGVESHYKIVDRQFFKRRVRLEFTVLYPKEEKEEEQEGQQEEEEPPPSRVVIEEVSSVGGEDEQEQQQAMAGSVTAVATTAAPATATAAAEG